MFRVGREMAGANLRNYCVYGWDNFYCDHFSEQKMNRYVTIVQYIDVRTGEVVDGKEMKQRNFLEKYKNEDYKYETKFNRVKRIINHFGIIGSESKRNSQLRLL